MVPRALDSNPPRMPLFRVAFALPEVGLALAAVFDEASSLLRSQENPRYEGSI